MLKVRTKSLEPIRIYQLTNLTNLAIVFKIGLLDRFCKYFQHALYHKWDVKSGFAFVLQFFSPISDGLAGLGGVTWNVNGMQIFPYKSNGIPFTNVNGPEKVAGDQ